MLEQGLDQGPIRLQAQLDSESARLILDLIIRIGGYSEYFINLDRGLQDSVIARTEHRA